MATREKVELYRGKDTSLYSTAADQLGSTTALDDTETFTGEWHATSGFVSLVVACLADQGGSGTVQFSSNASDIDEEITFTVTANTSFVNIYKLTRSYVRVKLENDSGANQTFLRLQCTLGYQSIIPLTLDSNGNYSVDVSGEFTPSGFQTDALVKVVTVSGTATAIPTTALAGRNAISIFNKSFTDTLYIGKDNTVTADDTATGGWEIGPRETLNEPVSDKVSYFGITTGGSVTVKVRELA